MDKPKKRILDFKLQDGVWDMYTGYNKCYDELERYYKNVLEQINDLKNLVDELTIENADLRSLIDYYESSNLDKV